MKKQIVITGIGVVSGFGLGRETFWNAVKSSEHAIKIKQEWNEYEMPPQYFGPCVDFKIRDHFKLRPPFPNYYSQLGLLATKFALEDSKLDLDSIDPFDIGCILNTYYGSNQSVEKYLTKLFEKGPKRVSPLTFTQTTVNHIVGDIARYFEMRGPSTISMGEESINLAIQSINTDQAKIMVCGGVDHVREFHIKTLYDNKEFIQPHSEFVDHLFENGDTKNKEVKNFLGEGSCFLVLEEKSHAEARGAHIYAEILGSKSVFDCKASTDYYKRDNDLQSRLINKTLSKVGVSEEEIDLVVGNATLPNMINEFDLKALDSVGYEGTYTSVLTRLGDCRAANTPLSLAVAALAINDKTIPGCGYDDHLFDSDINVPKNSRNQDNLDYAMIISTQLGGSSSCFVLKEAS